MGALEELEASADKLEKLIEDAEQKQGSLVLLGTRASKEYWVWHEEKERYTGPHSREAMRKVLERDCPFLTLGPKGEKKDSCLYNPAGGFRSAPDVYMKCGQTIDRFELIAGLQDAEFDNRTRTLTAGISRFRTDIKAERNDGVARWLSLLAGDQEDSFLDWLATFRRVTEPTCGVYVQGVSSAGKEMLALGLAQLFESRQYIRYESLTSDFNDGLLQTALVYADEKMPDQGFRRGSPSAVFRTLTGSDQHEVNGKGKDKVTVTICPRVLVTANGERALNLISEGLEENAVEAIGKRILHLHPPDDLEEARDYLVELGGREKTRGWVSGGGIAKHVLWLEQEREVVPGSRFLVEGNVERARRLIVGHDIDRVLDVLVLYLQEYDRTKPRATDGPGGLSILAPVRRPGIVPVGGDMFVNSADLFEVWSQLNPEDRCRPSKTEVGRLLGSAAGRRKQVTIGDRRVSGYLVSGAVILQKAEALCADTETIHRILSGESREEKGGLLPLPRRN